MALPDDNWSIGTASQAAAGSGPLGLILQQLKIMNVLLREGLGVNIRDEDLMLLAQTPPTLSPPIAPNPNFVTPL